MFRRNSLPLFSGTTNKPSNLPAWIKQQEELKIKAARYSETSVYFYLSLRRHNTEQNTIHTQRCKTLKSSNMTSSFMIFIPNFLKFY
jgi:hypothetical protein